MRPITVFIVTSLALIASTHTARADAAADQPEGQLPRKMHSAMTDQPHITVGRADADLIGADNRALQAAVDYIAALGGGVVEIGPGEYLMRDSLHLRSFVTVRGTAGKTILRKADGVVSTLATDGDYGEEQITLSSPTGFDVGYGVTVWDADSGGFHTTVARITGRRGNVFSINKPLNADCQISRGAKAATVFPIVSGCDIEGARVEGLTIEGNKERNVALNGCRGGGIYLYRGFGTTIENCRVHGFNGDGISFQQSNDVTVLRCVSEENAVLGIHPGSGSQRPVVRDCEARANGEDGLFLCWRVKYGLFEGNLLEGNGRYGISIGHKDTDNLLQRNQVRGNHEDGVYFRDEAAALAGHRNRLERNVIENNGSGAETAGIRVRGETNDLVIKENTIRDTRPQNERRQTVGVKLEGKAGPAVIDGNQVDAPTAVKDERGARSAAE